MNRCKWVNLDNPIYIKYHDEEWSVPSYDDRYLFEIAKERLDVISKKGFYSYKAKIENDYNLLL